MPVLIQCFDVLCNEQRITFGYFSQPILKLIVYYIPGECFHEQFADRINAEKAEREFFAGAVAEDLILYFYDGMPRAFIGGKRFIRAVGGDDQNFLLRYLPREIKEQTC